MFLTLTLSGFEILNDVTLSIQNLQFSRFFANIFHHLNFVKKTKIIFASFQENLKLKLITIFLEVTVYFDYEPNCHLKIS